MFNRRTCPRSLLLGAQEKLKCAGGGGEGTARVRLPKGGGGVTSHNDLDMAGLVGVNKDTFVPECEGLAP